MDAVTRAITLMKRAYKTQRVTDILRDTVIPAVLALLDRMDVSDPAIRLSQIDDFFIAIARDEGYTHNAATIADNVTVNGDNKDPAEITPADTDLHVMYVTNYLHAPRYPFDSTALLKEVIQNIAADFCSAAELRHRVRDVLTCHTPSKALFR